MAVAQELIDAVVSAAGERVPLVVGVTGGIAAGKSTVAAAIAQTLGIPAISTDGFIRDDAGERKGFADSYDAAALVDFVDAIRRDGKATAPRYSHLHYEVVGYDDIEGNRIVIDGLHLGHPDLGVRDRIDVLVHLDAPTETLSEWYLGRFQELRTLAKTDETAMLYPYRDMDPTMLDNMAMQVWESLNAVVIETEVRPYEAAADIVVRLGAEHQVLEIIRR